MPEKDLMGLVPMVLKAMRRLDRRVIFPIAPGRLPIPETRDCCFAGETPHAFLFPRLSAVIHHGGAGTTATAARAGVPQIVVPHVLDQYYWGNRVYRLGLGPAPIWRFRLSQARLESAVGKCLTHGRIQSNARKASRAIEKYDGTDRAVRFLTEGLRVQGIE